MWAANVLSESTLLAWSKGPGGGRVAAFAAPLLEWLGSAVLVEAAAEAEGAAAEGAAAEGGAAVEVA